MKKEVTNIKVVHYNYHEDDDLLGEMDFNSTEIWGYDDNNNLISISLLTEEGIVWNWSSELVKIIDTVDGICLSYSDVFGLRFLSDDLNEYEKQYYRGRFLKSMKIDHSLESLSDLDDYELRKINHWLRGRF